MKLIEVARHQRDLLNEGIAWVAVWKQAQKNGKASWFTEDIFPDGGVDHDEPIFSDEQKSRLTEIAALDENAVLLNGYIHSWIGSAEEPLNAASIAKGIENHYLMHNALIKHYLAGTMDETESFPPIRREEFEPDFNGDPGTITIELPAMNVREDILRTLIASRASLITAALGADGTADLPIEFAGGKVKFAWLRADADSDTVAAWSAFLAAACKFSKTAKRVTAKDEGFDEATGKFQLRVFCVKIGMNGAEHKWARKYILRNLKGSSSFATQESADRWNAKHTKKGKEVVDNEISE